MNLSAPVEASDPSSETAGLAGPVGSDPADRGLAAELRESLLLLACAVVTTVGLTAAAQGLAVALG